MSRGKGPARHMAREAAFQVLYGLTFAPAANIAELETAFRNRPAPELPRACQAQEAAGADGAAAGDPAAEPTGFDWELVKGVWKNLDAIDRVIDATSRHWRVERMGRIELTILRIGVFELTLSDDPVPPRVAMDEAIELTRTFAGEKAIAFVNGVLDAVARQGQQDPE